MMEQKKKVKNPLMVVGGASLVFPCNVSSAMIHDTSGAITSGATSVT